MVSIAFLSLPRRVGQNRQPGLCLALVNLKPLYQNLLPENSTGSRHLVPFHPPNNRNLTHLGPIGIKTDNPLKNYWKMEATVVYLGIYCGYIGIMEKKTQYR